MYAIRSYYGSSSSRLATPLSTSIGPRFTPKFRRAFEHERTDALLGKANRSCEAADTAAGDQDGRITSYNVCYTKLLRLELEDLSDDPASAALEADLGAADGVDDDAGAVRRVVHRQPQLEP